MAERRADYIKFIGRLAEGDVPEATPEQLDALLHWLAGRGNEMAQSIAAAFDFHDIPLETARRRTMIYLDATLFADDQDAYRLFGLTPDCDVAAIRQRHKQLMQVLHPDRHDDNPEWFTERSERINHAYADLKANHGRPAKARRPTTVTPPPSSRQPRPSTQPAATDSQSLFANKDKLRRQLKTRLGNPASLEKRVYIILVAVPVILLVVVFVHQTEFDGPQERDTVVDRTQDPGNRNADTTPEFRHPDDLIAPPVTADSQPPQASPRNTTNQAEAAPREPDANLPTIRDEYAIAADAFDDPETGAKPDVQVITAVEAATADEPEPAEPDSAEIPAAAVTTDIDLHPEAPAPVSSATVETDAPVVATTTLPGAEKRHRDNDIQSDASLDNGDQPKRESPTDSTANRPLEPTQTDSTPGLQTDRDSADAPSETPVEPPTHTARQQADSQPGPEQTSGVGSTGNQAADPTPGGNYSDAAPESIAAPDTNSTAPEQPETQGSPAPAPQPEQAKAPDKQKKASPEPTPGLPAIRAFLNKYQSAYNVSDIDRFTRLFQQDATSKHANSRSEIAEKYQSLFNRTRDRNLVFKDVRFVQIGERQYKVNTDYEVKWTYPDGKQKTNSGRFEMLLITEGEDLKIWRLDY